MTDSSGVVLGGLDRNVDKLSKIRNLMFAACGTSLYASQYGAKLMRDMGAVDTCHAQVRPGGRGCGVNPKEHSGGPVDDETSNPTR